jgi:lysyl-tRNA synthetase class 2
MSDRSPVATNQALIARARILSAVRAFLDQRGLIEVTTPVITDSGITDLHIESVALDGARGFLRTSPEYAHKRLLARGLGDLYELGPVFRAGESGRLHRIEFTLLEWYRLGMRWQDLAQETLDLCQQALQGQGHPPWTEHWLDWAACFTAAGLPDPLTADDARIEALTEDLPSDCSRDMRLDWLFSSRIQTGFPEHRLSVVHGYPASQAALARLDPDDLRKAQRFEVFAGPVELANGYQELTDPVEQERRFEADNQARRALGRRPMPIDRSFLAALEEGLPECAGVALGIDRLAMVALGVEDIGRALTF